MFTDPVQRTRQLSVALFVWAWCTKTGSLDWVITLFQLSVMPNTIIVGIPVLSPLYSITGSGIAAVFIGQVLWLFPILFLYELRAVKKLELPVLPHDGGLQAHDVRAQEIPGPTGAADGLQGRENGIPGMSTCFSWCFYAGFLSLCTEEGMKSGE